MQKCKTFSDTECTDDDVYGFTNGDSFFTQQAIVHSTLQSNIITTEGSYRKTGKQGFGGIEISVRFETL